MNNSYSMPSQQEQELLSKTEQKLYEKLRICRLVEETINTRGWQEIILPSLNRMIQEEVGGRLGDKWIYGKIQRTKDTDNVWFHIGAKQSLMEFHNHIYNYLRSIEIIKSQIRGIEAEKTGKFERPMMEVVRQKAEERPYGKEKKEVDTKGNKKTRRSKKKSKSRR